MGDVIIYEEHKAAMYRLTKTWTGDVGKYIERQTKQATWYAKGFAPKPGGPGHGRTKINFATGQLASSIVSSRGKSTSGELEGYVIALPKHALYVHEGTKPHVIKARRAPFLVFYWHRIQGIFVGKKVNHPGTPSDPFLWKGVKRMMNRMR